MSHQSMIRSIFDQIPGMLIGVCWILKAERGESITCDNSRLEFQL